MKELLKKTIIVIIMLCPVGLQGQSKYNLPPRNYYENATLGFHNFRSLKVQKLNIDSDSISYINNGVRLTQSLNEINYIRVRKGNKDAKGAMLGALTLGLISLSAVVNIQFDTESELKPNATQYIILYIAGGALVGGLIGSAIKVEKSYYINAAVP